MKAKAIASLPFVLASFVVIFSAWWALQQSSTFQICSDPRTYQQKNHGTESPDEIDGISHFLFCASEATVANHDLVITVSTIFIAIFTLTLWVATHRLQLFARQQAETERPYIFIFGAAQIEINAKIVESLEPFVRYMVGNYGKTPASVEQLIAWFYTSDTPKAEMPPQEEGTHRIKRRRVFPTDHTETTWCTLPPNIRYISSDGEVSPKDLGESDFYFRVIVRYRGPYSGNHESSACWILDGNTNRFVAGPTKYNYER